MKVIVFTDWYGTAARLGADASKNSVCCQPFSTQEVTYHTLLCYKYARKVDTKCLSTKTFAIVFYHLPFIYWEPFCLLAIRSLKRQSSPCL